MSGEELARVRQSRARILLLYSAPYLICRQSPADTVWTRLLVPRRSVWGQRMLYVSEGQREGDYWPRSRTEIVKLDTCNMDRKEMSEVLLTCESSENTKSAINTRIIHLLDVSHAPRLLLSALIQVEFGVHFSTRQMDFGRELRIGVSSESDMPLTPLVPGRYRYQGGRLMRVPGQVR